MLSYVFVESITITTHPLYGLNVTSFRIGFLLSLGSGCPRALH